MLIFHTELPISNATSIAELINIALEWIAGSPHTELPDEILQWDISTHNAEFTASDERLVVKLAPGVTEQIAGIRYNRSDRGKLEWETTIVGCKSPESFWVGVNISCDAVAAGISIPDPKKPQIIRQLIEKCEVGDDGELRVGDKPNFLNNNDIEFAADAIRGALGNSLPIVYISADSLAGYSVRPPQLAQWLAGMAHVLVEPNRAFSFRLMEEVNRRNAYNGSIGIYWPRGLGRRIVHPNDSIPITDLQSDVVRQVREALAMRRARPECTWSYLEQRYSKVLYDRLKEDKSASVEEYVSAFDGQLAALQSQLDEERKESIRLQAEVRKYEAQGSSLDGALLKSGKEHDLYENEIIAVLVEALRAGRTNLLADSRRAHIIDDVLIHNEVVCESEEIAQRLKRALNDYRTLDTKCRKELEVLGFEITEDGKHYKAVFCADDRYIFALPKTSSDHRAGKNMASEIIRKLL